MQAARAATTGDAPRASMLTLVGLAKATATRVKTIRAKDFIIGDECGLLRTKEMMFDCDVNSSRQFS